MPPAAGHCAYIIYRVEIKFVICDLRPTVIPLIPLPYPSEAIFVHPTTFYL